MGKLFVAKGLFVLSLSSINMVLAKDHDFLLTPSRQDAKHAKSMFYFFAPWRLCGEKTFWSLPTCDETLCRKKNFFSSMPWP